MDTLERIICRELNLRAYAVSSTAACGELLALKQPSPLGSVILGQAVNAALLLSATLKPASDQNLTYKIECSGELGTLMVQVDANGNMRALMSNPWIEAETVSDALGAGVLTVTKDIGMKEPYSGLSHIAKGDIAYDTAFYLMTSEQTPSLIVLGFTLDDAGAVRSAGGVMIQTFPDTPDDSIDRVERNIRSFTPSLADRLAAQEPLITIVKSLLGSEDCAVLSTTAVAHRCRCSHERVRSTLRLLEVDELNALASSGGTEIVCSFCSKQYRMEEADIRWALDQESPSS